MNSVLLIAGFSCFGAGLIIDLVAPRKLRLSRPAPHVFALIGSALCLAVGINVIYSGSQTLSLGSLLGFATTTVVLDGLAAFFLILLFAIGVLICATLISWSRRETTPRRRGLGGAVCTLLAAVGAILIAGDAFFFLFAWEVLTVSMFVLVALNREHEHEARAAWLTLVTGKVSGACLLFGFLLLAGQSHGFLLSAWMSIAPGTLHDVAYAFIVVGFATKLGVVPLQAWMPVGYPAALGPTRAAMAGIAANVGVYGLWRALSILGRPPVWLVIGVLLAGGVTAVLGIAFAGVQSRLSRVIAYSSVENAGIILTAFGVALAGRVISDPILVAAGLLAATLHVVAHAIAKSLLFAASANAEQAIGNDNLESLRGIGRSLPLTGWTFAAGALTLAGLPPTVGFVSEWFVLEALMQEFRLPGLALRLAMVAAGALIALTSGLAALAFIRILGLVFLGPPDAVRNSYRDKGIFGRLGLIVLAVACFAIAAITPLEIRLISRGLAPIVSATLVRHALKSAWIVQPTYSAFSILSPSWLYVVMPILLVVVTGVALLLSRGRYFRVRRVPAWHSATTGVSGPSNYTAFGFANPLRHVLANILGTRQEVVTSLSPADSTRGRGAVAYTTRVVEPVETYVYRPLRAGFLALSRLVKRLQSGRLEAYVAYMLFALIVALAVTAGMH